MPNAHWPWEKKRSLKGKPSLKTGQKGAGQVGVCFLLAGPLVPVRCHGARRSEMLPDTSCLQLVDIFESRRPQAGDGAPLTAPALCACRRSGKTGRNLCLTLTPHRFEGKIGSTCMPGVDFGHCMKQTKLLKNRFAPVGRWVIYQPSLGSIHPNWCNCRGFCPLYPCIFRRLKCGSAEPQTCSFHDKTKCGLPSALA